MNKEIERAVLKITQAMEKNRKQYVEADANYRDTGYDRYWNKMQKLDIEYEELKTFLHGEKIEVTPETIRKLRELQAKVTSLKSKWEILRRELPASAETCGIDDILKDIKTLLN